MKKFSISNQQNMIQMISSLYLESGFTINDMAKMLNKTRRTVFRYLKHINDFAPIILSYMDSDDNVHFKLVDKISEKTVDFAFSQNKTMPLIYLFLVSLCRKIKIGDIEIMFSCSKKEALNMRKKIFDSTHLGNIEYEEKELEEDYE